MILKIQNKFDERRSTLKERARIACWQNEKEFSEDDKQLIEQYAIFQSRLNDEYNDYIESKVAQAKKNQELLEKQFAKKDE